MPAHAVTNLCEFFGRPEDFDFGDTREIWRKLSSGCKDEITTCCREHCSELIWRAEHHATFDAQFLE